MAKHDKIDFEKFEQDAYREIAKGNTTVALIAQAMKISNYSTKRRLDEMVARGRLFKKTVNQICYYSRCELRAHDPFGLARKAA